MNTKPVDVVAWLDSLAENSEDYLLKWRAEEASAAIAELIAADEEYDADFATGHMERASARRAAALARVKGEVP